VRIAVIGAGRVGSALGAAWSRAGHSVMLGVRDTESARARETADRAGAALGSLREAASFGEVVVLCVPWAAVDEALAELGDLAGKPLLDVTNPLTGDLSRSLVPEPGSGAAKVASRAPGAHVVKIFNSTGSSNMADPAYPEGTATMPYCGDDEGAKRIAAGLAGELGFEPIDLGGLDAAGLLESQARLWIRLARLTGRDVAFRLMRR